MSKVPLQDDPLYGLGASAMAGWRTADYVAERLVAEGNRGNDAVCEWLDALIEKGTTKQFRQRLSDEVFDVEIPHVMMLDPKSQKFTFMMRPGSMTKKAREAFRDAGPALAVIRIIEAGYENRVRRCELEDCRAYFVGDPRSRWCSKTCGSRHRVRNFRRTKR